MPLIRITNLIGLAKPTDRVFDFGTKNDELRHVRAIGALDAAPQVLSGVSLSAIASADQLVQPQLFSFA
jgi:hypothetical protein